MLRTMATEWVKLSDEERKKYIELERADRERYAEAKILWASTFKVRVRYISILFRKCLQMKIGNVLLKIETGMC